MKCLVTGAAGFIGSHLCERLIWLGHEVTGIDNLSVGRESNLSHLGGDGSRFRFEKGDVCDIGSITGFDWVFHLAARADIVPSITDPAEYHRSNVTGTMKVLEAARHGKVKKFIYAASSSCYGIQQFKPTPEYVYDCDIIDPQYPYAFTKYIGELYLQHWAQVYGVPYISLRLFNVYGPRARTSGTYGAVMGTFLAQLINNKALTVVGDGTQTRDFTFVTDVVDAFIKAAESDQHTEIYNVGSGGTYSINRLVELLGAKDVVRLPKRPGEPDCTFADIDKIKIELKWAPKVSFESGVKIMLEHLADFKDAPLWTPESIAVATKDWFEHLGGETK